MNAEGTVAEVLAGTARFAVVCGERDDVLASMGDAAADVTITDPPYNERTHASCKTLRNHNADRVDLGFGALDGFGFVAEMLRVTRRWCLAFCAIEDVGEYQSASGEAWVRAGVWHKPDSTPRLMADRPAQGAEGVAIMHRRGKRTAWNGGGSRAHWTCGVEREDRCHPTQKPLRLMRELVRLFSDPGEVVADWHAGSGTTGVAALLEGRRVILVERNPEHAETCRRRCAETVPGEGTRKAKQLGLFSATKP